MREQVTMIARSVFLVLALLIPATGANAQSAPSPVPPTGFSSRGHLTVNVPIQTSTIYAGARLAVSQRDQLTRIDLLSVDAAILPIRIPQLTFVIDRRANIVTGWNDSAHIYYTQSFLPSSLGGVSHSAPVPEASNRPSRLEHSPLANLDLLTFNMRLTGRTTVAGIPSSGLAFDAKIRQYGKIAISHVTGTAQLADDFAFFPTAIHARIQSGDLPRAAVFAYAVDAFDRGAPPAETFAVPNGYSEATSMIGVLSGIPRQRPASAPSPAVSPSTEPTGAPN